MPTERLKGRSFPNPPGLPPGKKPETLGRRFDCCDEPPNSPLHFLPALSYALPPWFQSIREWVLPLVHFLRTERGIRSLLFLWTTFGTQPMQGR